MVLLADEDLLLSFEHPAADDHRPIDVDVVPVGRATDLQDVVDTEQILDRPASVRLTVASINACECTAVTPELANRAIDVGGDQARVDDEIRDQSVADVVDPPRSVRCAATNEPIDSAGAERHGRGEDDHRPEPVLSRCLQHQSRWPACHHASQARVAPTPTRVSPPWDRAVGWWCTVRHERISARMRCSGPWLRHRLTVEDEHVPTVGMSCHRSLVGADDSRFSERREADPRIDGERCLHRRRHGCPDPDHRGHGVCPCVAASHP